jgi:feruloyl esterase
VQDVPAGTLKVAGKPIAEHCLVQGQMNQRVSAFDGKTYAIGFEMRLPVAWNGRFFYQANGGLDGNVVTATGEIGGGGPLNDALNMGFAVISSDAGHSSSQNPLFGLDPQARIDYGYNAVATLTPMAKQAIHTAYGKAPDRSYFEGCSNGGRHAMVAAARSSAEYDGIIAGDPRLSFAEGGHRLNVGRAAIRQSCDRNDREWPARHQDRFYRSGTATGGVANHREVRCARWRRRRHGAGY